MKAILVVFFRKREEESSQELRNDGEFPAAETSPNAEEVPPFWTWFIQNPRLNAADEVSA